MSEVRPRVSHVPSLLTGGLLVAIGILIGGSAGPGTVAAARQDTTAWRTPLPAIPLEQSGAALVQSGGVYWLIGRDGWATPVRYRDNSLRPSPGETLLPY